MQTNLAELVIGFSFTEEVAYLREKLYLLPNCKVDDATLTTICMDLLLAFVMEPEGVSNRELVDISSDLFDPIHQPWPSGKLENSVDWEAILVPLISVMNRFADRLSGFLGAGIDRIIDDDNVVWVPTLNTHARSVMLKIQNVEKTMLSDPKTASLQPISFTYDYSTDSYRYSSI